MEILTNDLRKTGIIVYKDDMTTKLYVNANELHKKFESFTNYETWIGGVVSILKLTKSIDYEFFEGNNFIVTMDVAKRIVARYNNEESIKIFNYFEELNEEVKMKFKENLIIATNEKAELIKVVENEDGRKLVSARELHEFLESKQDFTTWIKSRIEKYEFENGIDFTHHKFMEGRVWKHEYVLTVEMAKELSMLENNEKGRQARKYFIACEKKLKDVQEKGNLLLDIYNGGQAGIMASQKLTEIEVKEATNPLLATIKELTPKAEIYDVINQKDDEYDLKEVASMLDCGVGRNKLFEFLRKEGILMSNNEPYKTYSEYLRYIPNKMLYAKGKTVVKGMRGVDFIRKRLKKANLM